VRRSQLLALVLAGVTLFLLISALLARGFSVDWAERAAITAVVRAEAHGDAGAVLARLSGCAAQAPCQGGVRSDAAALRHSGAVAIIQIQGSAGFSLTGSRSIARVAWTAGGSLPIVQCLRVRRAGNVLSGLRVELLALTPRIVSDAACPARF